MLNISNEMTEKGEKIILLEGELDTLSSHAFEKQMDGLLTDTDNVIIDMERLEYITSAGLRVLFEMESTLEEKGSLKVINVCEEIREVFELVGFTEVLDA